MTVNELIKMLVNLPEGVKNEVIHVAVRKNDILRTLSAPIVSSVSVEPIEVHKPTEDNVFEVEKNDNGEVWAKSMPKRAVIFLR